MGGVIGGDGVDGAVGEARDQGFAIFAGGERRIHFVAGVVLHVFIDQREMMRRDFASDVAARAAWPNGLVRAKLCAERCAM